MRKLLIATLAILLMTAHVKAQTLDDAIDAELDEVSAGDNPSAAPKAKTDEIQLDDGGSSAPQAQAKPQAKPQASPQTAPQAKPQSALQPQAKPQDPAAPDQGLVEDELKIDDVAPQQQAQKPAQTPTDDIKLDDDTPAQQVAKPQDTGGDIQLDEPQAKPQIATTPQTPQAKPQNPQAPQLTPQNPQIATTPQTPQSPQKTAQKPAQAPKSAVALDGGNAAYEKRLAQFARGYKQVPDVNWDEIVGDRRQENYRLQKGDTLWDISETFFGDGFFWAKLWSQNGVIGNPHKIIKGHGIRFVAGTEADAPAIAVIDKNQNISTNPLEEPQFDPPDYREQAEGNITQEEIDRGDIETSELIPAPELPPPNKRQPVLKTLPKSLPETHVDLDAGYDASGLNGAPMIAARVTPPTFLNSMILDGKPEEVGKIDEIELSEKVAGIGQGVFLNANRELAIGQRITFIRRRASPAGAAGPVVDIEGVGVVDGVIKENSNTYHVTITTALVPVERGALAITEPPPLVVINREGKRSDVHVKVVGGEFDDNRKLLGGPAVVYLNGGAGAGLHKGDLLGVEAKRGTRRDTRYPTLGRAIAVVKVADVRSKVATAVVVQDIDAILIGDMTGGDWPEELPGLHIESASESASKFGQPAEPAVE